MYSMFNGINHKYLMLLTNDDGSNMMENNIIEWKLLVAGMIFLGIATLPYNMGLAITKLLLIYLPIPGIMVLFLKNRRHSKSRFTTY